MRSVLIRACGNCRRYMGISNLQLASQKTLHLLHRAGECQKRSWRGKHLLAPSARSVWLCLGGMTFSRLVRTLHSHQQHRDRAAGRVARRRCSLSQPGCRKAGAKAGPALPGWSDPMGAPSLISPGACGARGAGRTSGYWSRLPVLRHAL